MDNVSAITLRSGKEVRPIMEKVRYSNEKDETEVKRVRFSDKIEEISAMPRANMQPTQTSPRDAEKLHLQQATVSRDVANLEQQTQSLEPQIEGGEDDELESVLTKSIFDADMNNHEFVVSD
ncbi:hypothetical protein GOBAR_DD31676 [Gossypium barbadense]|nr:hypothetical protein GOBAR_DD31676 [Gossypium barbadense]